METKPERIKKMENQVRAVLKDVDVSSLDALMMLTEMYKVICAYSYNKIGDLDVDDIKKFLPDEYGEPLEKMMSFAMRLVVATHLDLPQDPKELVKLIISQKMKNENK